jgi:23S rRNA (cytidine2498-2'-O)-methyltransferase
LDHRSSAAAATLDAFVTSVGFETALLDEIQGGRVGGRPGRGPAHAPGPGARPLRWPAVVAVPAGATAVRDPVFGRQPLPGATLLKGDSVRALAEGAYALIEQPVDGAAAGFLLQVFVPDPVAYARLAGRAALLAATLDGLLRGRRGRAVRRSGRVVAGGAAFSDQLLVVQGALVARTSLLVSASRPRRLPHGAWDLAPWPAGIAAVPDDRTAPSRAHRKLEESFAWLGAAPAPGELCVDLGGAPGGWTWCALKRGARVVTVDRAPLLPPAAGHPALTMVRGDAFAYRPAAPVDWLLCDVICEPRRTLDLAVRWMEQRWCRRLVATVKFKGRDDYALLAEAARRLGATGWRQVRIKHLYQHHNEVAVLASAELTPP